MEKMEGRELRARRLETYSLANKVIPSFKLSLSFYLYLFFLCIVSDTKEAGNINQASMGRTSEPASGNVRSIGLKAFSLFSNGLPTSSR